MSNVNFRGNNVPKFNQPVGGGVRMQALDWSWLPNSREYGDLYGSLSSETMLLLSKHLLALKNLKTLSNKK